MLPPSAEEWKELFPADLSEFAQREAWDGEKWVPVRLPQFITRCKTEHGYLAEFTGAGFAVLKTYVSDSKDQYFNAVLGGTLQ